ncbi:uroporphyrinogen-III synthase [Phyllobacterium sp. K27]
MAELGFQPLVLPLSEVEPLQVQDVHGHYDAVAITSANALRHAPEDFLATFHDLPCFAVGGATADIAQAKGFKQVLTGNGNGSSLAEKINNSTAMNARVLYLAGRVRSPEFEEIVGQSGRGVTPVLIYDTILKRYETDYLVQFFNSSPVNVCLVYSKRGAATLLAIIEQANAYHLFENTEFLCLSDNIVPIISSQGFRHMRAASVQDEVALLELLHA